MGWKDEEIRRVSFTTDGRGKISCGGKDEKGMYKYPYFVVTAYPEIVEAYGEEPAFLLIELENSAGLEDVIQMEWMEFKMGGLKRKCDKKEFMVFADNVVDMVEGRKVTREKYSKHTCVYPACECRMKITIYCHILHPETMLPITKLVRVQNGSVQSFANIQTMMKNAMGKSPAPELEEKLVKALVWRVNVVMKKQKIGKGPTFEIEAVGWKRTRSAHNLLEAAGFEDPGVSVKLLSSGEQAVGSREKAVESENSSSSTGSSSKEQELEFRSENLEKQEQIDKDMSFTMDDVFGVKRDEEGKIVKAGEVFEASFEEIDESNSEFRIQNDELKDKSVEQEIKPERRDSFWLIKRLNGELSEVEFRDLLLDFNELNRANGIGLMELGKIKIAITDQEEKFRVKDVPKVDLGNEGIMFESPNSNKAGTGAGISSQSPASEVPVGEQAIGNREQAVENKSTEHAGFSESSVKVLKKVEECKTMEEWLICLTLYNALRVKADEKKRVCEILFKKKGEVK